MRYNRILKSEWTRKRGSQGLNSALTGKPPCASTFYIKSFVSTSRTDKSANSTDIPVSTSGKAAFPDIVKSPTFACVSRMRRKEDMTVAFDDFMASPIKRAIKPMVMVTADFKRSWM